MSKGSAVKKAVLVVSFGTSYKETREKTIEAIETDIAEAFKDYEIRRAFTSGVIIRKLAKRDGIQIDTVTEAMERLASEGFKTVIVQPTHVMHGAEYDDMLAEAGAFANRFQVLIYGRPLLSRTEDYEKVVNAIVAEYGVENMAEDTALVLMGHGTHHFANSAYGALDYMLKDFGHKNVFVGTVEGYPEFDSVLRGVQAGGYQKAVMAPLMVVAGDHAQNDMAGEDEDSWKEQFKMAGIEAVPVLKGLGEIEVVRKIYVAHVKDAMDAIDN